MKNSNLIIIFIMLFIIASSSQAGAPLWTFTPLTATTISIPANGTATVQYQVTNQSSQTHRLAMNRIMGVTQITNGSGACGNPFVLLGHQSCLLVLQIDGSQAQTGNTNGPIVCEQDGFSQCYRPSAMNTVNINIAANQYHVGGMIDGLTDTIYLQNNGTDLTTINSNGPFAFATLYTNGTTYNVTIAAQPTHQTCHVTNGVGIINGTDVTNVAITCSTNIYAVGGTISGLSGTVVLLNNGGDANTITSNGFFIFLTPVAEGSPYNITVGTQPAGQTCTITNGSGIMGSSNVTNVNVSCAINTTTLSTSVSNLALATNGNPRTITITNTGSNTAENLSINYPTWPSGTLATSTCSSTLNASDSCVITITPGNNATSNCNNDQGSAPIPGMITVNATNAASPMIAYAEILAHGCIYQEGYIFDIDDTTSTNTSISGKIASLTNISNTMPWFNGSYITTVASSFTNGASNTAKIITVQGSGNYAAQACTNYIIDSSGNAPCSTGICYTDWYLPAICELGASGENAGCTSGIGNMQTNLPGLISNCNGSACLANNYWSSTEITDSLAWYQYISANLNVQNPASKSDGTLGVRCARVIT